MENTIQPKVTDQEIALFLISFLIVYHGIYIYTNFN